MMLASRRNLPHHAVREKHARGSELGWPREFSVEARKAAPTLRAARPRASTSNFMGKQHNKEIKRSRRTQLLKRRKEALRTALATPGAARKAAAERKAVPKKKAAARKPAAKKTAPVVAPVAAPVAAPISEASAE